jgi:hypothetical protein
MLKIVAALSFALATAGCATQAGAGPLPHYAMCGRPTSAFSGCRPDTQRDAFIPVAETALVSEHHRALSRESLTHMTTSSLASAPHVSPRPMAHRHNPF